MAVFLGLFGWEGVSHGANYSLEIILPKAAGTGNPAIPATNRIFRAYPGIEYNIRAAVIGGTYPYSLSLSGAPPGMTINSSTGEISWPNPQADSGVITLSVTDSENAVVQSTWAITVAPAGFTFVDANYSGSVESGTISQPYKSISSFLNNIPSANYENIVYFRGGNYVLPVFHPDYYLGLGTNIASPAAMRPYKWLAYPGETVNINGNDGYIEANNVYFDGLNFTNFSEYGIRAVSGANYNTLRRSDFSNLVPTRTSNGNQGFYFSIAAGTGNYHIFQDNKFHDFSGAAAIGSLYSINKILIENNNFYDFKGPGITSINAVIAYKSRLNNGTVRRNIFNISNSGRPLGTTMNSPFFESDDTEINFNLFMLPEESGIAAEFNDRGPLNPQGTTYFYRNTMVGNFVFKNVDGLNCAAAGPYYLSNNVIINSNTPVGGYAKVNHLSYHYTSSNNPDQCINKNGNLLGLPSDNIVDANGNLTPAYSSYLGTTGWQIAQATSDTTAPAAPRGLVVQ